MVYMVYHFCSYTVTAYVTFPYSPILGMHEEALMFTLQNEQIAPLLMLHVLHRNKAHFNVVGSIKYAYTAACMQINKSALPAYVLILKIFEN